MKNRLIVNTYPCILYFYYIDSGKNSRIEFFTVYINYYNMYNMHVSKSTVLLQRTLHEIHVSLVTVQYLQMSWPSIIKVNRQ